MVEGPALRLSYTPFLYAFPTRLPFIVSTQHGYLGCCPYMINQRLEGNQSISLHSLIIGSAQSFLDGSLQITPVEPQSR